MLIKRRDNLEYAVFQHLRDRADVFHAVFTRNAPHDPAGLPGASEPVFLNQVHGSTVAVIRTPADLEAAAASALTADAVICAVARAALVIRVADCQPILLHDPGKGVVANIHAGWRGSIAGIIGACIDSMRKNFGTDPADITAGIGPSLGPCCAEFVNFRDEIPEPFWKYKDARDRFDFWQISIDQLLAAGLRRKNIELACMCTRCNPHLFFSYRREGQTGRFAAVIGRM